MTAPFLFDPPPAFPIPLSLGSDFHRDFIYKPMMVDGDGEPVLGSDGKPQYVVADYPAGASVTFRIDTDPPVSAAATVTGPRALVHVDHLELDGIVKPVLWRLVLTTADGVDTTIVNGVTARKDGR